MYKRIAEVRLTSYALISALEQDFRELIASRILPRFVDLTFLGDQSQIDQVSKRFLKDNPGMNPSQNAKYVIEFLDFQDAYKTLLAHKDSLEPTIVLQLKKAVPILDTLVPIRNRIMHSRPLLAGDFTQVYNFCSSLVPSDILPWSNTIATIENLAEDPSFVFTVSIPTPTCPDYIAHNLPMPDFDESGFIGREDDAKDLLSLIAGNTNVVSLIGDGGIGKTALMLKVAYDILRHGCRLSIRYRPLVFLQDINANRIRNPGTSQQPRKYLIRCE